MVWGLGFRAYGLRHPLACARVVIKIEALLPKTRDAARRMGLCSKSGARRGLGDMLGWAPTHIFLVYHY